MSGLFRTLVATLFMAAGAGLPCPAQAQQAPDFGDDASRWANDGECDDPRFAGPGMSDEISLTDDIGHDASDCAAAWRAGQLTFAAPDAGAMPDFGDDDGEWANDGECDDPRFAGPAMTETTLLEEDILHDATDCRTGWEAGELHLK